MKVCIGVLVQQHTKLGMRRYNFWCQLHVIWDQFEKGGLNGSVGWLWLWESFVRFRS